MSALSSARRRPEVRRLLDAARIAVDMDSSLLTVHEGDVEVVLATSSRSGLARDAVGRRTPLSETYCGQVLAGRMAPWIPDARADPVAAASVPARELGVGSYVGAPMHDDAGAVVGMLCCISRAPDARVGPTSVAVLESLALALAAELGFTAAPPQQSPARPRERAAARRESLVSGVEHHRAVRALARGDGLEVDFEPVVSLVGGQVRAWVAHYRAVDPALDPPCDALQAAGRHGLAVEVENTCLRAALEHQGRQPGGTALAVGVTSRLLQREGVVEQLLEHARGGLWVRVDHGGAPADATLLEGARRLRDAGAVLAVDGARSPSANLVDALRLRPHLVGVSARALHGAGDGLRPGLVEALLAVTRSVGARLVASDVATPAHRTQLRDLGVPLGRGPAVGDPGPLPPG